MAFTPWMSAVRARHRPPLLKPLNTGVSNPYGLGNVTPISRSKSHLLPSYCRIKVNNDINGPNGNGSGFAFKGRQVDTSSRWNFKVSASKIELSHEKVNRYQDISTSYNDKRERWFPDLRALEVVAPRTRCSKTKVEASDCARQAFGRWQNKDVESVEEPSKPDITLEECLDMFLAHSKSRAEKREPLSAMTKAMSEPSRRSWSITCP